MHCIHVQIFFFCIPLNQNDCVNAFTINSSAELYWLESFILYLESDVEEGDLALASDVDAPSSRHSSAPEVVEDCVNPCPALTFDSGTITGAVSGEYMTRTNYYKPDQ